MEVESPLCEPEEIASLRESPPSPQTIREHLASRPGPTVPMDYNVEEAEFWQRRFLPAGSVLEFLSPTPVEEEPATIAVMVLDVDSRESGMWVSVKVLGASTAKEKKEADKYFKGNRRQIHICYPLKETGVCPRDEEDAVHLRKFKWFPAGDYDAPWLSNAARKTVANGKNMEAEAKDRRVSPPRTSTRGAGLGEPSLVEKRLGALRRDPKTRVSFSDSALQRKQDRREDTRHADRAGTGGDRRESDSRAVVPKIKVKEEVQTIRDSSSAGSHRRPKKSRDMGQTLARAARIRNAADERKNKEKKKKSRSRSRGRRRRKKRRTSSGSDSQDSSPKGTSSSSEESMMAPLKKRSMKVPGSVFKMLEQTAVEKLSADGIIEEGYEASGLRHQRPKLLTYYQLVLKPNIDPRGRDARELAVLARALDLLREGRLAELSDMLAARLVAIETSTRQGWATAKHLEIYHEDEEGSVPPHVLLQAQKHARAVEKAGGKGSWPRSNQWSQSPRQYDQRPKGKGKDPNAKGKKGKGKGKGPKGNWNNWGADPKDKTGDKPKKPEAEG
eukprot:s3254_g11.t1